VALTIIFREVLKVDAVLDVPGPRIALFSGMVSFPAVIARCAVYGR
jgi:hypothetical protein